MKTAFTILALMVSFNAFSKSVDFGEKKQIDCFTTDQGERRGKRVLLKDKSEKGGVRKKKQDLSVNR